MLCSMLRGGERRDATTSGCGPLFRHVGWIGRLAVGALLLVGVVMRRRTAIASGDTGVGGAWPLATASTSGEGADEEQSYPAVLAHLWVARS